MHGLLHHRYELIQIPLHRRARSLAPEPHTDDFGAVDGHGNIYLLLGHVLKFFLIIQHSFFTLYTGYQKFQKFKKCGCRITYTPIPEPVAKLTTISVPDEVFVEFLTGIGMTFGIFDLNIV
jgi:hypothetical protein